MSSQNVSVALTGTGEFYGDKTNVIDYSYTEGSTPLVPGDESGAIGDISISVLDKNDASILLYKDTYLLDDEFHGAVQGTVESVSGSNDVISMGGRSILAAVNIDAIITPRSDNIGNIIEGVIGTDLNLTLNILKDSNLSSATIRSPGFEGDAWVYLKRLCSAHNVEISVIENYIVVRPVRQRTVGSDSIADKNWQIQDIELAQTFDVAYYNYVQRSDYMVYPEGGWNSEVQVYQVAANETTEFELDLEFFLTSVQQPTVQDSVAKEYNTASVYAVSGNDNLPISGAFWTDNGGDIAFEILGDGSRIKVTITGPSYLPLSPYTIGISDGSTSYSTLRIVGTGMDFNRQLYTAKTGLTATEAPVVKGAEIDNPAIDTLAEAKQYALFARRLYSLPTQTYGTTSNTFPRLAGSTPSLFYPTFAEFDETLPGGYDFNDFNSDYSGYTFEQFTTQLANTVPQGFGEISGSRIKLDDAFYRVRSDTITPGGVSIDAEYDTLISDFNAENSGRLFSDFNTTFAGVNFNDFALIPLRTKVV